MLYVVDLILFCFTTADCSIYYCEACLLFLLFLLSTMQPVSYCKTLYFHDFHT